MDTTEFFDELEKIMIIYLVPMVQTMKDEGVKLSGDNKVIARNLIGKVGIRIVFGNSKDIQDIILGK